MSDRKGISVQNFEINKPKEKGNAVRIREVCHPTIPLTLVRYEAISDYYTEEPKLISVKPTKVDDFAIFEQVFRLRIWVPNEKTYSWCIYSEEREWMASKESPCGIIVRHVVWDRKKDLASVKRVKDKREGLLKKWPTITTNNVFLSQGLSSQLIKDLKELDNALTKGILLRRRKRDEGKPEWGDFEIMRLYDWGQVHATWSPIMTNSHIECYTKNLSRQLELYITGNSATVYQMDLDYSYPTEIAKDIVYGELTTVNCKPIE